MLCARYVKRYVTHKAAHYSSMAPSPQAAPQDTHTQSHRTRTQSLVLTLSLYSDCPFHSHLTSLIILIGLVIVTLLLTLCGHSEYTFMLTLNTHSLSLSINFGIDCKSACPPGKGPDDQKVCQFLCDQESADKFSGISRLHSPHNITLALWELLGFLVSGHIALFLCNSHCMPMLTCSIDSSAHSHVTLAPVIMLTLALTLTLITTLDLLLTLNLLTPLLIASLILNLAILVPLTLTITLSVAVGCLMSD